RIPLAFPPTDGVSPFRCRQTGRSHTNQTKLGASSRPHPEVDVSRPLPLEGSFRNPPWGLVRGGAAPILRRTASVITAMAAMVAPSVITGPALAEPLAATCELERSQSHHSEGVDTWNASYTRPVRPLEAVMIFLSFKDAKPVTTPAQL